MKKHTHIIFGVGLSLCIINPNVYNTIPVIILSALSSIIPDFDLKIKHRKTFHNINFMIIYIILIYIVVRYINTYLNINVLLNINTNTIIIAALTGYASHIVLDSLTLRGVDLFWPFSNKRFGLMATRFDSRLWNTVLTLIGLLLIILWFKSRAYDILSYLLNRYS